MATHDEDNCCRGVSINGLDSQFGQGYSSAQLKMYRRDGLGRRAVVLLEFLRERGLQGKTVLDIGSGIGALHMELLLAGAESAVGVDGSTSNIAAARQLAGEMGLAERAQETLGDFVEIQDAIPMADIVTLDRAICCYPAIRELLTAAGAHGRGILALTMPRRTIWMRAMIRIVNIALAAARRRFRVYDHSPQIIDATLSLAGFRKILQQPAGLWEARVYERERWPMGLSAEGAAPDP